MAEQYKATSNTKGLWHFEETSGITVADASGLSHPGTASRTQILAGSQVFPNLGNCGSFASASSDVVTIVNHADLRPTTAFTIVAWFKTTTSGVSVTLFQSYSLNANVAGWNLIINASNKLRFAMGNNTGVGLGTNYQQIVGGTTVTDGNIYCGIITWSGTQLNLYLNGVSDATQVAWSNAPSYAATNYVQIGAGNNTGAITDKFNGNIDEVILESGAWSAAQCLAYYKNNAKFLQVF